MLVLVPAAAILAAFAAVRLMELAVDWGVVPRRAAVGVLAAFLVLVSLYNTQYYFREFIPSCAFQDSVTRWSSRIGSYLATLIAATPPTCTAAPGWVHGTHPGPVAAFLSRDLPTQNMDDASKGIVATEPPPVAITGRGATFVFVPERQSELERVAALYPAGQTLDSTRTADSSRSWSTSCRLPDESDGHTAIPVRRHPGLNEGDPRGQRRHAHPRPRRPAAPGSL